MCKIWTFVSTDRWSSPPRAAAAGDRRTRVADSPTSSCSRVFPWRRGGLLSGDRRPHCSSRTLTAGRGDGGPSLTTLYGMGVGSELPVPSSRNGRRRQPYKTCDVCIVIIRFPVRCYSYPQGRGPGFRAGPTYFGLGPELHTQPILDRLGCVSQKLTRNPDTGRCLTL